MPNITKEFTQASLVLAYKNTKEILLISKKDEVFYFFLQDFMGVPKDKKIFKDGKFKNLGFYVPNSEHEEIFLKSLQFILEDKNKAQITINGKIYEIKIISIS